MEFKIGDLVTRNSYNNDMVFTIIDIKDDICYLKGINIRLYADSSMEDLKKCDSFIKIELNLNESEAEIVASRRYYNDIITDYNKIIRTFPSNIVAKLCGYKQKTYFDGKDMTDDKINDFKL